MPPSARLGHAPTLDGLRGIAVLAVFGHNLGFKWLQGGFFGVDLFFALSGFLITTLLVEDYLDHGAVSLRKFFRRRFLRLYPALVVLVIASAVSSLARPDVEPSRLALVMASTLGYFSNWVIAADSRAWVGGMGHTWSLAVEMHFYVVWALVIAAVTRRWGLALRPLLALAVGVAFASAAWRIWVWSGTDNLARAYGGTDTRFDAVFLGAAAALLRLQQFFSPGVGSPRPPRRWAVRIAEGAIAVGLAWLILRTPDKSPCAFLGGFGLVGAAAAVLILTTLHSSDSWLARPLRWSVLRWFGEISYSLYLWHLPVKKLFASERLVGLGIDGWLGDAACVAVSLGLAVASYYGVERAFQGRRQQARR